MRKDGAQGPSRPWFQKSLVVSFQQNSTSVYFYLPASCLQQMFMSTCRSPSSGRGAAGREHTKVTKVDKMTLKIRSEAGDLESGWVNGEPSEGVEIGVETEHVSGLSVAEVGLPRARRQPVTVRGHAALAEEGWAPSLICAQPMKIKHLPPRTTVFLSSRFSFPMMSSGHLCTLVHI